MEAIFYKSRIGWWVYAIAAGTFLCGVPGLFSEDFIVMSILCSGFTILEIFMFARVKYAIKGDMLGIRTFYRWEWFPVEKISELRKVSGILSAPACSARRIAIRFSDKSILKSSLPLEISPKNRDSFMQRLKDINPNIVIKTDK